MVQAGSPSELCRMAPSLNHNTFATARLSSHSREGGGTAAGPGFLGGFRDVGAEKTTSGKDVIEVWLSGRRCRSMNWDSGLLKVGHWGNMSGPW